MGGDATLVEPGVVGDQEPAFARGRVLVPLQTEHAQEGRSADLLAGEGAAVGLGAILNTGMRWRRATAMMAFMLQGAPAMCTGTMSLVRGVIFRSRSCGSMQNCQQYVAAK